MLAPAIGRRVHVMGHSCAGKSTLGSELAQALSVPLVELDALNWLPGWVGLSQTDPEELRRRIAAATTGDGWVLAGSYSDSVQPVCWDRLQTVVWLDLPLLQLLWRMLRRSWQRWRSKELLWGTNYEKFWQQLAFWRGEESLLWWIVSQYRPKQRHLVAIMATPEYAHIRFIRLRSAREVLAFKTQLQL
ncbi:MAG: hypothetical protein ACR2PZ_22635 [Pseudomonadales bacterium]